jgi:hypothetical protein
MNPQERDAIRKRCLRGNYEDIANVVDHDAPALLDALEQAERLRLAAESEAACQARGVAEVNRCREELRAERDALEKAGLDALRTAERLTGELAAEKARGDRNADTVRSYGRELDAEIRKREEACAELAAEKARGEEWRQAYESATTRPYAAEAARLSRDLATQTKRAEEAEAQAKLGWQRAAEKDRAYGDSLRHLAVLREAGEKLLRAVKDAMDDEHGLIALTDEFWEREDGDDYPLPLREKLEMSVSNAVESLRESLAYGKGKP